MFCFKSSKTISKHNIDTSVQVLLDCRELCPSIYYYNTHLTDQEIKVHGGEAMPQFTRHVSGGAWIQI